MVCEIPSMADGTGAFTAGSGFCPATFLLCRPPLTGQIVLAAGFGNRVVWKQLATPLTLDLKAGPGKINLVQGDVKPDAGHLCPGSRLSVPFCSVQFAPGNRFN